ncbi:MAG: VanZ family protein [Ruminococcus sp.]|nr:VanZ family protein [Ruminococcus sp.]
MYRKRKFDKVQQAACIVLFMWGAIVLLFTVLGRRSHNDYELNYNLELFSCYRQIFVEYDKSMLKTALQNILMFVPIGFTLFIVFNNKHRVLISIAVSFGLSLFIEICQLFLKSGIFELDDLLNNTIGGLIGIILCLTVSLIYHKVRKNHRKEDSVVSEGNR